MEKPKVSVIMPIYNVENYLSSAIESIVEQTLKDLEIILVNDGSTDGSYKIMEKYLKIDSRIKIISQNNMGQSIARNEGLKISSGKYIYFMDGDDILEKDALEICYEKCQRENLNFVIFDLIVFFEEEMLKNYEDFIKEGKIKNLEDKVRSGIFLYEELFTKRSYLASPCTIFIEKEHLERNNIRFYPKIIHEDELFIFLVYLHAQRTNYIKKSFFKRRIRQNSTMTTNNYEKHMQGYMTVIDELEKYKENVAIEKKEIIQKRQRWLINYSLGMTDNFEQSMSKYYKKKYIEEYYDYLTFKSKIRAYFPKSFLLIKKIKQIFIGGS